MLRFILLYSLCLVSFSGKAQMLENYESNWVIREDYLLLERILHYETQLPVSSFPESFFKFQIPSGHSLFVEGVLWKVISGDTIFSIPVKYLKKEFKKDTVQISILGQNRIFGDFPMKISKEAKNFIEVNESNTKTVLTSETRIPLHFIKDFYYVSTVILLFFLAAYRSAYPYFFGSFV